MPVISRIGLRVLRACRCEAISEGPVGGAGGVSAVGRIVMGVIVLARPQDALTGLLMGPIPVNGMLRRLDRERRACGDRQKQAQADNTEKNQLSVPVNIAAACSWPCRMLCSAAC